MKIPYSCRKLVLEFEGCLSFRVILPPITTTAITTTRQYNVSAVLQSTPISLGDNGRSSPSIQDGFAAYSTALSCTIAIGCSLLILNLLIFAGVYYQRDKSRTQAKKISENGGLLASSSISGDINTPSEVSVGGPTKVDMTVTSLTTRGVKVTPEPKTPLSQTHLPPPEFADYPVVSSSFISASHCPTLPRTSAPQAGRHATCDNAGTLTLSVQRAPAPPRVPPISEAQPLLQQQQQQSSFTPRQEAKSPPPPSSSQQEKNQNTGELRV